MVVEDDASLREIYSIRITAEGYEVVSAGDGEEALAVAVREKPDLILSDVMMPKISGFDMLDILRSTPETADIKVIMMTALSADDQRERGERLGANRYLVKSQVGIEDVVNAIHDVLGDRPSVSSNPATAEASSAPAPVTEVTPASASTTEAPVETASAPATEAPAEPAPASSAEPSSESSTETAPSLETPAEQPSQASELQPENGNENPAQ